MTYGLRPLQNSTGSSTWYEYWTQSGPSDSGLGTRDSSRCIDRNFSRSTHHNWHREKSTMGQLTFYSSLSVFWMAVILWADVDSCWMWATSSSMMMAMPTWGFHWPGQSSSFCRLSPARSIPESIQQDQILAYNASGLREYEQGTATTQSNSLRRTLHFHRRFLSDCTSDVNENGLYWDQEIPVIWL